MPESQTTSAIRETFEKDDLTFAEVFAVRREVYGSIERRQELQKLVEKDNAFDSKLGEAKGASRRAIAHWILGKSKDAAEEFGKLRATKETQFFQALAYLESGGPEAALEILEKLKTQDFSKEDGLLVETARYEALEKLGRLADVLAALPKAVKAFGDHADLRYHSGMCHDLTAEYAEAEKDYKKALELDPEHEPTLFRLAYNHDLRGEDKEALEVYERLKNVRPPRVATLLNLGVLYEDRGDFQKAADCYEQVLDVYPNHQRAQLYYKDARASLNMYYDEEAKRKEHRWGKLLGTPIGEFQLSVRSRNCLAQINVLTLGDMVRKTEEELLAVRNFGETSLKEIRELLTSKGLRLARPGETGIEPALPPDVPAPLPPPTRPKEDVLQKPVGEFEWSARAKKALESMGVVLLADLTMKSEKELLGMKNFGTTSLNEVKQKLAQYGLSLKE